MKSVLCLFTVVVFCTKVILAQNTTTFKLKVTQLSLYCGGEQGPDARYSPLPNKKLVIKKGNINNLLNKIMASVITNGNGEATVKLKPGKYYIVDEFRLTPLVIPPNDDCNTYDSTCMKALWLQPNLVVNIKPSAKTIVCNLNFVNYCDHNIPCTQSRCKPE